MAHGHDDKTRSATRLFKGCSCQTQNLINVFKSVHLKFICTFFIHNSATSKNMKPPHSFLLCTIDTNATHYGSVIMQTIPLHTDNAMPSETPFQFLYRPHGVYTVQELANGRAMYGVRCHQSHDQCCLT